MAPKNPTRSSGRTPDGQTSRGNPSQTSVNPKNNSTRRPDVIGKVPGEGGSVLLPDNDYDRLSDEYPSTISGNSKANRGNPSSEPTPAVINRGYTQANTGNTPAVRVNTGSNRQRFGIATPDVPEPDGDTRDTPTVPKHGTGGIGD